MDEIIRHLAVFISGLWQIHIFGEGNTRTTAVFLIKYLRTLGFETTNDIFAENAWYFRNALVRANYNHLQNGIYETTEYLELFLRNLLCGEKNELHNRSMHISGICAKKPDIGAQKPDIEEQKPDIDVPLREVAGALDFSAKLMGHIQKMQDAFGKEMVFGRTDVQRVTELGSSSASELLKVLREKKVIGSVAGYGKGKYRFL